MPRKKTAVKVKLKPYFQIVIEPSTDFNPGDAADPAVPSGHRTSSSSFISGSCKGSPTMEHSVVDDHGARGSQGKKIGV